MKGVVKTAGYIVVGGFVGGILSAVIAIIIGQAGYTAPNIVTTPVSRIQIIVWTLIGAAITRRITG